MKLYLLNHDYINYLKEFDDKVPNVEYKDKFKLFLGKIRISSDLSPNINFYIPLTSYKEKFEKMSNRLDFIKIEDPLDGQIIGALDINNMIPAPDIATKEFEFEELRHNANYQSHRYKEKYFKHLAMNELAYLNSIEDKILHNARTIFSMCRRSDKKYDVLRQRCCDFLGLYNKAVEFDNIVTNELSDLIQDISNNLISLEDTYSDISDNSKGKDM